MAGMIVIQNHFCLTRTFQLIMAAPSLDKVLVYLVHRVDDIGLVVEAELRVQHGLHGFDEHGPLVAVLGDLRVVQKRLQLQLVNVALYAL